LYPDLALLIIHLSSKRNLNMRRLHVISVLLIAFSCFKQGIITKYPNVKWAL
jgi:hypothetical protein